MRAFIENGRPAIETQERDEFGQTYTRVTMITVDDADRLRRELWDVVSTLEPGRSRAVYRSMRPGLTKPR